MKSASCGLSPRKLIYSFRVITTMRPIFAVLALALVCGCTMNQEKTPYQYVCPEGQVVANPGECAPATTTTTTTDTTSTTATTSSSTTTSSTTTTTAADVPTTTLTCQDQSVDGYLMVNDAEDRCWHGYKFRLDSDKWNCTIRREGCSLGVIVTRPDGEVRTAKAGQSQEGNVIFTVDGFQGEVAWTREDLTGSRDLFIGVIKF
jgi:hypothetical protein